MRFAINGFGRVGRTLLRVYASREDARAKLTLAAINEIADADTVVHLARYDSNYGRYPGAIARAGSSLVIDQRSVPLSHVAEVASPAHTALVEHERALIGVRVRCRLGQLLQLVVDRDERLDRLGRVGVELDLAVVQRLGVRVALLGQRARLADVDAAERVGATEHGIERPHMQSCEQINAQQRNEQSKARQSNADMKICG